MGCAASKPAAPVTDEVVKVVHVAKDGGDRGSNLPLNGDTHSIKDKDVSTEEDEAAAPPSPRSICGPSPEELEEAEEARRLRSLLACKMLDTPPERRFDTICTLLQSIFQVPIAVVGLIDTDRLYLKSLVGSDGQNAHRIHSFCDASLKAPNPTMMIVPDTLQDARFTHNQFVTNPPFVRFYCGAPLISSEGYVMGSLGLMDIKPRTFPAELCNVICNFAELVVRELERDKAESQAQELKAAEQALQERQRLQLVARASVGAVRSLDCFKEAVLLCDASKEGWPLLYCNDAWCKLTGFDDDTCLQSSFGQLFSTLGQQADGQLAAAKAAIQQQRPFIMHVSLGQAGPKRLRFRPATRDHLGSGGSIPLIGIPPFMKPATSEELASLPTGFYFAVVEGDLSDAGGLPDTPSIHEPQLHIVTANAYTSGSSGFGSSSLPSTPTWSVKSFDLEAPEVLGEVVLGPLLGSGAHGRVYRGTWKEMHVAVKILDSWVDPGDWGSPSSTDSPKRLHGPALEAALSQDLVHPNLVQTFDHAFNRDQAEHKEAREPGDAADSDNGSSDVFVTREHCQCWIIEEYCTHGTLLDAVDRGWLRSKRAIDGPVDMKALLLTARDIASGLAFLHSNSVLHGDLSGNNVLLASAPDDPRGFVAKVGDFGLARVLESNESIKTHTHGTVSHMPPELLERGELGRAADVYSFGVLLWEMYSCAHAWCGQRPTQIFHRKVALKQELALPASAPSGLQAMVGACLSPDPSNRPTFDQLLLSIHDQLAMLA